MRKYLFYLLTLLALVACSEDFEGGTPAQNQSSAMDFNSEIPYLRLQDDSTNLAGVVESQVVQKTSRSFGTYYLSVIWTQLLRV